MNDVRATEIKEPDEEEEEEAERTVFMKKEVDA
jgi:hypothetical protein